MPESSDAKICARVAPKLPGVLDEGLALNAAERHHMETCLSCQAEVVSYKKLLRAMRGLRSQVVEPAPGLLADVLTHLGERAERRAVLSLVTGRRAAYAGGVAVVAAAGVTGAVVLAGRSKTKHKSRLKRAAA